ncbi:hypothetical protein V3C99_007020, partial [Haemonchus contortus]
MLLQSIAGTLAGCVGCQAGVELLEREVKNSLNLFTLVTCIFVALEGLIFHSKMFTVRQAIPTRVYLKIVVIFFIVNLCNNYAIKCDIYFPLFIIFKSGSLLANIILGYTLRNHFYTRKQISSVIAVTCGIVIFTLASYDPTAHPKSPETVRFFSIQPFFIGIFLLTAALMLSAYLGVCQEDMYRTYGKHAKESMFMVHLLSIPGYALLGPEIVKAFDGASRTPPLNILGYDLILPRAWGYILGICVLQYICIKNVYRLTALTTSLNVTMVITLRKFLSLFVSFVAFGNPFNAFHFFGAAFVFIGSLVFSNV